jgi:hypothetical protein
VDSGGPQQNARKDRGNPSIPRIQEGCGKVTQGEHTEKRKEGISEEGQEILDDRDIWTNETTLRGVIYESRNRERTNQIHIHDRLVPEGRRGTGTVG